MDIFGQTLAERMERKEIEFSKIEPHDRSDSHYRVVFESRDGGFTLPMIVGVTEARAILQVVRGERPARVQTHDLFAGFVRRSGYELAEAVIYQFDRGVYRTMLVFRRDGEPIRLDCRTSDALALVLRVGGRFFVEADVVSRVVGLTGDDAGFDGMYRISRLERLLDELVAVEKYEEAATVRDQIRSLRGE